MKRILFAALALAALSMPALADSQEKRLADLEKRVAALEKLLAKAEAVANNEDDTGVPPAVLKKIKANMAEMFPESYRMQKMMIDQEVKSWLELHGPKRKELDFGDKAVRQPDGSWKMEE
ncbi:MAG TPA: hypothetical protein VNQ90_02725 [Chthoniobacteraceae bacterium]|nr:hypothetical protein [Chthoniobacteraceae bacterium]